MTAMQDARTGLNERKRGTMTRSGVSIAVLAVAAGLAGCSPGVPFDDPFAEYTQRSLTISPSTGNAQAANLAMQTSGPWPLYSQYTNIPGNGSRMVKAVQNFESGTGSAPASASGGGSSGAAGGAPSSPATRSFVILVAASTEKSYFSNLADAVAGYPEIFFIVVSGEISARDYKRLIQSGNAEWVAELSLIHI